jgi:hypothetical protein
MWTASIVEGFLALPMAFLTIDKHEEGSMLIMRRISTARYSPSKVENFIE